MTIRLWRVSRRLALWSVLFFAGWLAALVSGLVAGKGIDKLRITVDSGAGEIDD
jgi:hypothetical protein